MSLRDIQRRIKSIRNTSKVTRALEAVSATKMRRWQERALAARPYAIKALALLASLKERSPQRYMPFQSSINPEGPSVMIVISADKGLCGGYNARLMNLVEHQPQAQYIALGKYGRDYLKRRGYEILLEEIGFGEGINRERIAQLYGFLETGFARGLFSRVLVAYTEFHTTLKQEPKIRQLLPVSEADLQAIVEGIVPRYGRYAQEIQNSKFYLNSALASLGTKIQNFEYLFEPSARDILPVLTRELTQVALYHMVLEANASEHSARMVAMKNATDNAKDILKELNLHYNKARQAEITKGVLEVASGAQALT